MTAKSNNSTPYDPKIQPHCRSCFQKGLPGGKIVGIHDMRVGKTVYIGLAS